MNNILCNKIAVVTGASGGLGKAIALNLAKEGCHLRLLGRKEKKLLELKKTLKENFSGIDVDYFSVDFQDLAALHETIASIQVSGTAQILINCAGVFPIKDISSSTIDDYNRCFDINVRAPFVLSQALMAAMKEAKWGRIVNVGSSSAYNGSEDTGLYCASKHALLGLSRSLKMELARHDIRVFSVSPGSIQTDMGKSDSRQDFTTFLKPSEIADYITFIIKFDNELVSDELRLNRVLVR